MKKFVQEALNEYNENNAEMPLVLFQDAIQHVCRITRVIQSPSGHCLLVGVGGMGKQSLAKLSSYILGYSPFQIVLNTSYKMSDLKQNIWDLYYKAGVKDDGFLWIFTDGHIKMERFLIYMNDLLASGDIAGLFTVEDQDQIIGNVRGKVKSAGLDQSNDGCWDFFMTKVRRNLHVCLCFSPVGDDFRKRAT